MKNPLMTLLGAAAMAALLAAYAAPAPEAPVLPEPSGPVRSAEQAEVASAPRETSSEDPALQPPGGELPVKAIPGCRADLPYPLKMSGESLATDFTHWAAKDLDGNVVTEEVLAGSRLTLVSVWSAFCDSCVADMAALQQLYTEYDRADLNIIGIAASAQAEDGSISEGEVEIIRQIQEMTGAEFLQLLPSDDLIAIKLKDLGTVPESFLLDSAGNVVGGSLYGGRTAEEFRRMVDDGLRTLSEEADA